MYIIVLNIFLLILSIGWIFLHHGLFDNTLNKQLKHLNYIKIKLIDLIAKSLILSTTIFLLLLYSTVSLKLNLYITAICTFIPYIYYYFINEHYNKDIQEYLPDILEIILIANSLNIPNQLVINAIEKNISYNKKFIKNYISNLKNQLIFQPNQIKAWQDFLFSHKNQEITTITRMLINELETGNTNTDIIIQSLNNISKIKSQNKLQKVKKNKVLSMVIFPIGLMPILFMTTLLKMSNNYFNGGLKFTL